MMRRRVALTFMVGCGALPWACSNGTTTSDDAGIDATIDHASDATKDVAVDAFKQDASDAAADAVDETFADASDASELDATDDADTDADTDAGICGTCPTSEVCCTIIKSFNYGKCYSPLCLACCM